MSSPQVTPANERLEPVVEESPFLVGDFCRALFSEDAIVYEAKIVSIDQTDEGHQFGRVRFIGYDNEEPVWLYDLLPSDGPEARIKQEQDVAALAAAAAARDPKGPREGENGNGPAKEADETEGENKPVETAKEDPVVVVSLSEPPDRDDEDDNLILRLTKEEHAFLARITKDKCFGALQEMSKKLISTELTFRKTREELGEVKKREREIRDKYDELDRESKKQDRENRVKYEGLQSEFKKLEAINREMSAKGTEQVHKMQKLIEENKVLKSLNNELQQQREKDAKVVTPHGGPSGDDVGLAAVIHRPNHTALRIYAPAGGDGDELRDGFAHVRNYQVWRIHPLPNSCLNPDCSCGGGIALTAAKEE